MAKIGITFVPSKAEKAKEIARQCQLAIDEKHQDYDYLLHIGEKHTELQSRQHPFEPLVVDFLSGSNYHRYRFGGGKNQLIAKACGIKTQCKPSILDLTGGLARDAFVLASLGCDVTMIERHPVIATLVQDGIERAQPADWFAALSLTLLTNSAADHMKTIKPHSVDVVYIDPMYPHRKKSALVKKDMQILREIVGPDEDSSTLLLLATAIAKKRVVVKRPNCAETLTTRKPDLHYRGKNSRYDVYLTQNSA